MQSMLVNQLKRDGHPSNQSQKCGTNRIMIALFQLETFLFMQSSETRRTWLLTQQKYLQAYNYQFFIFILFFKCLFLIFLSFDYFLFTQTRQPNQKNPQTHTHPYNYNHQQRSVYSSLPDAFKFEMETSININSAYRLSIHSLLHGQKWNNFREKLLLAHIISANFYIRSCEQLV